MYPERPSRDLTIMPSEVDVDNDAPVRETSLAAVTEVPLLSRRTVKRLCNFHSQRRRTNIKYVHRNRLCLIPLNQSCVIISGGPGPSIEDPADSLAHSASRISR